MSSNLPPWAQPQQPQGVSNAVQQYMWDQTQTIGSLLNSVITKVDEFTSLMDQQIADFDVPISDIGFTVPALNIDPFAEAKPVSPDVDTTLNVTFPGEVSLTNITAETIPMPSHNIEPPNIPDRPPLNLQDIPFNVQAPAVNTDVSFPTKPALQPLTAPQQASITIPQFDGLELPQWDGTFPDDDLGDLTAQYNYDEPAYNSELFEKIRAWITNVIENGGTGLGEEVFEAIRTNYKNWMDEELQEEYERILKFEASRGFTIPTGAMNARLRTFWNKRTRKLQEQDNQLMAEEARLAQTNTHFALQQGVTLEGILREAHNQLANRTLQHARESVGVAIEVYNARIARYMAALEGAKARASVFEARIRAAGLILEQHKAEIDAQKLTLEAKNQEVEVYLALQQGNAQLIDMWAKEMDASRIILENERNKILIFKEQIEGYSAQVNAQRLRVDAHNALLSGDQTRAGIYAERMRGYGILADTVKAQNQNNIDKALLQHEIQNKGRIEVHNAALNRADIRSRTHVALEGLKMEKYRADTQGFESLARAYQAYTGAKTQAYDSQVRYASAMIDRALKEAEINQTALLAEFNGKLEVLKARVHTWSQTLASALGTLSHSLSMGTSSSTGTSLSGQLGVSESVSHVHSYCEKACD